MRGLRCGRRRRRRCGRCRGAPFMAAAENQHNTKGQGQECPFHRLFQCILQCENSRAMGRGHSAARPVNRKTRYKSITTPKSLSLTTSSSSSAASWSPKTLVASARCRWPASSKSAPGRRACSDTAMCRPSGDHEGESLLSAVVRQLNPLMAGHVHQVNVGVARRARVHSAAPRQRPGTAHSETTRGSPRIPARSAAARSSRRCP